ncbi:MAG: DUF2242 domain-containing protein [Betaproteobacteria bacterium]|nr:DUF2242 domain-containing protein [Betaproteobacteria bacterium]
MSPEVARLACAAYLGFLAALCITSQAATTYASVQQERYIVKKSSISTSVGVSALGSISIPTSSSQDSLVKVAAETVSSTDFYDRFFGLMGQNLRELAQTGLDTGPPTTREP